ncbi:MAG TPA: phosphoribosylamine--glycine ligase [Acidimicrobiia bacterium]|nr:phosphoribosylamine--glycine ligase [Acidimicrobiia bacterium]
MRVLLVGSGGREHALGWKLARSARVDELISLPGNPGLAELGPTVEGIATTDVGAIAAMARVHDVDLVVIGPEAPLAAGVVDAVSRLGIPVFGPTRAAARLESSKGFAKEVMRKAGVATAASGSFASPTEAHQYLDEMDGPFVVKADGLAAGKGVLVTGSREEADAWVDRCFDGGFGEAGSSVLIEHFLQGPEVSVFAVCTEHGALPLAPARDYKRLLDGDAGPNTGGMGSYSPVDDLPPDLLDHVMTRVVEPTLGQMAEDGTPFTGFLYAGLVLTATGPQVLEFNVRLGDPETQAVLPRLKSDLVDVLEGSPPLWSDTATVNVVLAARGYPESPLAGEVIRGLADIPDDVLVFHGGTRRDGKRLVVNGGRVLNLVGIGASIAQARERAYEAVSAVSWPGMQYRSDIAGDAQS